MGRVCPVLKWTHVRYLPENYPYKHTDPEFACIIALKLSSFCFYGFCDIN